MTIEVTLDTKYFLDICEKLEFKDNDEKEAKSILGSNNGSVVKVLQSVYNRWAEHYIIRNKNDIVCVITLDIYNNLHYFVTKKLTKNISIKFVKTIKNLVDETVKYRHVIFVQTKDWYYQAVKFNKLIGFKVISTHTDEYSKVWMYSHRKGV